MQRSIHPHPRETECLSNTTHPAVPPIPLQQLRDPSSQLLSLPHLRWPTKPPSTITTLGCFCCQTMLTKSMTHSKQTTGGDGWPLESPLPAMGRFVQPTTGHADPSEPLLVAVLCIASSDTCSTCQIKLKNRPPPFIVDWEWQCHADIGTQMGWLREVRTALPLGGIDVSASLVNFWAPHFARTRSPQLPHPRELLCWPALWTPCTRNASNMEPMVPRLKRPTCHLDPTLRIDPHSPTESDLHCPPLTVLDRLWSGFKLTGTNTNLRDGRAGTTSSEESIRVKCPGSEPHCGLSSAFDDADRGSSPVHSSRLLQRRLLVAELKRCGHLTTICYDGCSGTLNTLTLAVHSGHHASTTRNTHKWIIF